MYCNKLNVVHPGSIIRRFQSTFSNIQLKNYCDLLGVPVHASEDRLKQAFYKKSLQYHPDRNPGNIVSAKLFAEINEAYQALLVNKREVDDRAGRNFSRRWKSKSDTFRQMHKASDRESRATSSKKQTWYAQAHQFTAHEKREQQIKFKGEIKVKLDINFIV